MVRLQKLFTTIGSLATLLLIVLAAFIIWNIYRIFATEASFDTYDISRVVSIEKESKLVTSVAALDLLWLKVKGQQQYQEISYFEPATRANWVDPEEEDFEEVPDPKLQGFCQYTLQVSFGIDNLNDILLSYPLLDENDAVLPLADIAKDLAYELQSPSIVAIYPEKIIGAPNAQIEACMDLNLRDGDGSYYDDGDDGSGDPIDIEEAIWASLANDGVIPPYLGGFKSRTFKLPRACPWQVSVLA